MQKLLLLSTFLLSIHWSLGQTEIPMTFSNDSDIEDIRLRNSNYGPHAGRVEILYNGTWGTICDDFWSFSDARVACQMLGFSGAVCAVPRGGFGMADIEVPIWMSNLQCRGRETALDDCSFRGWGGTRCTHREDAGVICRKGDLVSIPTNLEVTQQTRRTLTLNWTDTSTRPRGVTNVRYRISYQAESSTFPISRYLNVPRSNRGSEFTLTLTNLVRGTQYSIQVRTEVRYRQCFSYMFGNSSDVILARTTVTLPPTDIPIRLIPPAPGLDFMGRVEVFHNNVWGTVCDDRFSFREANVVCGMLNYTRAGCSVSNARLGRGTGQIWLDNVRCSSAAEILDDCTFNRWGRHNCDHGDDVGVVCVPDDYPGPIQNFTATSVSPNSVTLSWNQFNFPSIATTRRYSISYRRPGSFFASRVYPRGQRTSITISRLQFETEYNFTIRAEVRFRFCFVTLRGVSSDPLTVRTKETAPSCPPSSFHVTVLNCSSVRAEWDLPQPNCRNGFIRGYRLFLQRQPNGNEMAFEIRGNKTNEFIINELEASTCYVLTILAYTVGDGPRSIHLTVETNSQDICHSDLINFFGLNGNGLDRATLGTFSRNVHILCGTSLKGVEIDWYFPNGTKVGNNNRNIREGHFANGTTSLQIASNRRLSLCDSGVYTCRANQTNTTRVQQKMFRLTVGRSPPRPSRPKMLAVTDTSITVEWDENECNGGHRIQSYRIRYNTNTRLRFPFFSAYMFAEVDRSQRNYTIVNLNPSTSYTISVQAISVDTRFSFYSSAALVRTLQPAPSPPRITQVELLTPVVIRVTWRFPSIPRGQQVVSFTVYATPLVTQIRGKRQTDNIPRTVTKRFPGSVMAGNMTLPEVSVTYQVQITASLRDSDDTVRETKRSPVSQSGTLFVPLPGLPVPRNLQVSGSTNSSVSLRWEAPLPPSDPISSYMVSYFAVIDGFNKNQELISFTHKGNMTTPNTEMTVQPLAPSSSYVFKVSAIAERGRGAEVSINRDTSPVKDSTERFVFFQIRFGPVRSCLEFRNSDTDDKQIQLKTQLIDTLKLACKCDISISNIQSDTFSCGQLDHLILYRGQIFGSNDFSSSGLLNIMQSWVSSNQATLVIDSFRMPLDPSCPTPLNSLMAPDCPLGAKGTQHHVFFPTSVPTSSSSQQQQVVRPGEVGGIIVGVVIIVLLLALVAIIVGVILKRSGKLPNKIITSGNGSRELTNEDNTPFADLETTSANEGSFYEEKIKY